MKFESVIRRRIRRHLENNEANVDVEARVNAAIAGNIGENNSVATAVADDGEQPTSQSTRAAHTSTSEGRGG